jgi:hypothetical protein
MQFYIIFKYAENKQDQMFGVGGLGSFALEDV